MIVFLCTFFLHNSSAHVLFAVRSRQSNPMHCYPKSKPLELCQRGFRSFFLLSSGVGGPKQGVSSLSFQYLYLMEDPKGPKIKLACIRIGVNLNWLQPILVMSLPTVSFPLLKAGEAAKLFTALFFWVKMTTGGCASGRIAGNGCEQCGKETQTKVCMLMGTCVSLHLYRECDPEMTSWTEL